MTLIALVLTPIVVIFVHELGHAGFVLWASDDPVYVRVGRQPPLFTASIGRLDLSLHFLMESGAPAGFARTFASLSWDDSAAFALAGPFANIVLAFLAFPFLYDDAGHIRSGIAFLIGCSILTALANLVPYRRHGLRSDGLVALESWRGRSRCLVLSSSADLVIVGNEQHDRSLRATSLARSGGAAEAAKARAQYLVGQITIEQFEIVLNRLMR